MILTVYITDSKYAVELRRGDTVTFREICNKVRFIQLVTELKLPQTYRIVSDIMGIHEYMQMGQLKHMTPTHVDKMDKIDLETLFGTKRSAVAGVLPLLISYNMFLLGIVVGVLIMNHFVIRDMLNTREERISNAQAVLHFNETYGSNMIDATWVYAEFRAVYDPRRVELFSVDMDGYVEVMFLHTSPSLNAMWMYSLSGTRLERGSTLTIDNEIFYIYQLGGRVNDH